MKHPYKRIPYFFLWRFFLKRFLRLWVAILCLFLFFPLGIALSVELSKNYLTLFFTSPTKVLAGLNEGML